MNKDPRPDRSNVLPASQSGFNQVTTSLNSVISFNGTTDSPCLAGLWGFLCKGLTVTRGLRNMAARDITGWRGSASVYSWMPSATVTENSNFH